MDVSTCDPEIDDYLERYAAALTAFDAGAAAELWSEPGMIIDDTFSGVVADRAAMVLGLEGSYPLYRELGLASVGYECLKVESLSDRVRMVTVRWLFYDAEGEKLTDSNAHYLLRITDDGIKACVCVQMDDVEKIRALAEQRGVDLSAFG